MPYLFNQAIEHRNLLAVQELMIAQHLQAKYPAEMSDAAAC